MERLTNPQTWLVVFGRAYGSRAWWKPLINRHFQHVHLFTELEGKTLQFNPLNHVTAIITHDLPLEETIKSELTRGVTAILSHTVYYGALYKPAYLEPYSCVSAAKRVLGIRSRLITPKQLYHELIKAGAIVIKPYCVT